MKSKSKLVIIISVIVLILALIITLVVIDNNMVEINSYSVLTGKLPSGFEMKIAQISDFHNCKLKNETVSQIKEAKPDIIVITGDLIDSRKTNVERSMELINEITKIAPCYYVSGNHEARIKDTYENLKEQMIEGGVIVLENESITLEAQGAKINLIGLSDPKFALPKGKDNELKSEIKERLSELVNPELYNLVLCHRPEAFDEYVSQGADLIFTGHAHGGQIILPLFGGIIAPNQGLFPKYYKGIYNEENTTMAVSRGIGNSLFPFRMFNRPEVLMVELKGE